jgi:roadblock/LC7 domain-containing protein
VCRTLEATYIELIAHVKEEKTKMALKKCAADGIPASTTAITKTELAPSDCAPPLIKGWFVGTTKDAVSIAKEYNVMMRMFNFRAPIFILSASGKALLSEAVAAMISIPT